MEELVVRRELTDNFCFYNPKYDSVEGECASRHGSACLLNDCFTARVSSRGFPGAYEWAQKTLKDHATDRRPYVYTRQQLEEAQTHDELWNAAQVAGGLRQQRRPEKTLPVSANVHFFVGISIRWSARGRCMGS